MSISKVLEHHSVSFKLFCFYHAYFRLDAYGIGADGDSTLSLDALYALGFIISATDGRYSSCHFISFFNIL